MFNLLDENGGQRYDKTPGDIWDEILGGAGGKKDIVETATQFLKYWSDWFVQLVETIKKFFEDLKNGTKG